MNSLQNWSELKTLIQERISASKILIADDSQENINLLEAILKNENYLVDKALDGSSALKLIYNKDYDLILLDVEMPKENGFAVCKKVRANNRYNNTPIIFITALSEQKHRNIGFNLGAQDYLVKPINNNELVTRVKTQLELKHSREIQYTLNLWIEGKVDQKNTQLIRTIQDLKNQNVSKAKFVKDLNNEINETINSIYNNIDQTKKKAEVNEMLESLNRLSILVSRLERFSREELIVTRFITNGQFIGKEDFYLEEAILVSIKELKKELEYKNIEIVFRTGRKKMLVHGNFMLMRICVTNILSNAIKFSPPSVKIFISIKNNGTQKVCEIRDEGPGFSCSSMKKLITLFSSTNNSFNNDVAIEQKLLKKMVDSYNGLVQVQNAEKGGAIVSLQFE